MPVVVSYGHNFNFWPHLISVDWTVRTYFVCTTQGKSLSSNVWPAIDLWRLHLLNAGATLVQGQSDSFKYRLKSELFASAYPTEDS